MNRSFLNNHLYAYVCICNTNGIILFVCLFFKQLWPVEAQQTRQTNVSKVWAASQVDSPGALLQSRWWNKIFIGILGIYTSSSYRTSLCVAGPTEHYGDDTNTYLKDSDSDSLPMSV